MDVDKRLQKPKVVKELPLISVITVVFNNKELISQTIESLSAQTLSDYEYIVIDGGSTDGTVDVLIEYSKTIDYWISEPDKGIYNAMNKGIAAANGTYLLFMNAGDEFATEKVLEKVSNFAIQNEYPALIYGDSIDITENEEEYYHKARAIDLIYIGMNTQHQAMVFNIKKIKNISYIERYQLAADYALVCELQRKQEPDELKYLAYPICKYRLGGINEKKRFYAIKEDYLVRREVLELSTVKSLALYILHFAHTVIKKSFPIIRYMRHKKR
jgi:putative colanic acid biosynthesis glycosyltransferase